MLLSTLNDIMHNDSRCYVELQSDPDFQNIQSQFESVLTPSALCQSIKQIYPPDLF